jgi:DNA polymerase III sliding clamp (beta) subunit (PCNA family)
MTANPTFFDRKALLSAIKQVLPLIDKRPSVPMLKTVRLTARHGDAHLTATDLDTFMRVPLTYKGDDFDGLLDPFILRKLLPKLERPDVAMEHNDSRIDLRNGRFKASLIQHARPDQFPHLSDRRAEALADAPSATIDGATFVAACKRVSYAQSTERRKYYLRSVLWFNRYGQGYFCASDGHALAVTPAPLNPSGTDSIIPSEFVAQIIAALPAGPVVARVSADTMQLTARDGIVFQGALCDATYPDVTKLIDAVPVRRGSVSVGGLLKALARATAGGKYDRVTLEIGRGLMTLETPSGREELSAATEGLTIDAPYSVDFDPVLLARTLRACTNANVTLSGLDNNSPMKLDDGDTIHIVMPKHR